MHQHRRNYSQIITKTQQNTKTQQKLNKSLNKIQSINHNVWLLNVAKQNYYNSTNIINTIKYFEQYLQYNPKHLQSLYLCALCYIQIQEYNKSIEKLKQFISNKKSSNISSNNQRKLIIHSQNIVPKISQIYLLLAIVYSKIGNMSKAFQIMNQVLRQDNKYQQGYCFRAKLYLKIGQNQKAFFDYKQTLKYNNRCWIAWIGLGDYYTFIHNYNQAYNCYQKGKHYLKQSTKEENLQKQKQQIAQSNQFKLSKQFRQSKQQSALPVQKKSQQNNSNYKNSKLFMKKYRKYTELYESQKQIKQSQQINLLKQKSFSRQKQIQKTKYKIDSKNISSIPIPYIKNNRYQAQSTRPINIKQQDNINLNLNINNTNNTIKKKSSKLINMNINISNDKLYIQANKINNKMINQYQQSQQLDNIDLKIGICLYYLGEYKKSIKIIQGILNKKTRNYQTSKIKFRNNSQIFYYLGVNLLKLYQLSRNKQKNQQKRKANSRKSNKNNVDPINIILNTQSSTSGNRQKQKIPQFQTLYQQQFNQYQHHQYLQSAILNLQLSIKQNSNKKIMIKSYKTLVKLYIQNNQFYQTQNINKLVQKFNINAQIKYYKQLSQACMLVIKQKYHQASKMLKRIYDSINGKTSSKEITKKNKKNVKKQIDTNNNQINMSKSKRVNQNQKDIKMNIKIQQNSIQFCSRVDLSSKRNKTIEIQSKQSPSINFQQKSQSNRNKYQQSYQNQFQNLALKNSLASPKNNKNSNNFQNSNKNTATINHYSQQLISSLSQYQWMKPIILLFYAYCTYFQDNFIECLEIYEQYENYIKDYLGKQAQNDIYLAYNKIITQGILMLDNQMIQQSMQKFVQCIDNYYRIYKSIPIQPILYRILGLIKLSLSETPYLSQQINSRTKIYITIIQILDHYISMQILKSNPLIYYYYGVILYKIQKYKQASQYVEKCLKIADQCSWKYLYVKGLIQIKCKNYKDAIRQFSAGLIVQQKAQLYLGRCICYLQIYDNVEIQHNQQIYMQKSFQDLQKYIQIQQDKDKVSKWVTKLLFFNKAYQQVTKSIKKISNQIIQQNQQLLKISKYLHIYNGIFEDGGVLGQILINAFQGKYQQNSIQINGQKHQIMLTDFIDIKYKKWLHILNLYSQQHYSQLIKYLQLTIFQQKNQQDSLQLRYNLAIVYYLIGECHKGDNVMAGLSKFLEDINTRVEKFINRDFIQDQCIEDLQVQLKGVKRLSNYLPYRKIKLENKDLSFKQTNYVYIKISLPFPSFFKPNIDLELDDQFLFGETAQSCVPKKIEAPWIKKIVGNIQFTQNIVSSQNTSILEIQNDQDILASASQKQSPKSNQQIALQKSKQSESINISELQKF